MKKFFVCLLMVLMVHGAVFSQKKNNTSAVAGLKKETIQKIQDNYDSYKKVALQIWDYAEVGYKEVKSSALHSQTLSENGFNIETGVAGIPTAFVATYGSGKPVIGILAEYDALPGLSQQATAERKPVEGKDAGHGCGHHLFGTASVAAEIDLLWRIADSTDLLQVFLRYCSKSFIY